MDEDFHHRAPDENGIWQKEQDLAFQQKVGELLRDNWQLELIEMPLLSHFDFLATLNNNLYALVEVRNRSSPINKYKHVWLPKVKFLAIRDSARALEIRCFMVFGFSDGNIRWIDLTELERPFTSYASRGQMDHPSPTDNELVVNIPVIRLRPICRDNRPR